MPHPCHDPYTFALNLTRGSQPRIDRGAASPAGRAVDEPPQSARGDVDRRRGRRGARRGRRLAHLGVGDKVRTQGAVWTVTGLFDSNGDAHESELITDNKTLAGAMRRLDDVQTVTVMLDSPSALTTFKQALTSNPTLAVDVVAERDYFAQQSRGVTTLLCGPSGCPG
jgi:hypothetical protein